MSLATPTLHTARLRLRPFAETDAPALYTLHSNTTVMRYWDSPPWADPAHAQRFLKTCQTMADEGTGIRLAIDRTADDTFIGWCVFAGWDPTNRRATLGYCFDESTWGNGYATEAARALLGWAFDTLPLNRVQAETDTRNLASARVLQKIGFIREGTLREECIVNDEISDTWVFGLLRRDWESEPTG
ncbi:GNAT family N-acetyltransferase [Actinokineospora sp. NPDC004072]